ncbi:MAG: hypothetical protein HGA47_07670, partial [Zoogloea sp.]|nr:hypothetical protein [Zoogloea sp.]
MSDASAGLGDVRLLPVPPGGRFLRTCAAAILADLPTPQVLSSAWLILPNLLLARDMRAALLAEAGRPLLLPRIDTLPGAVAPWLARISHLPDVRRQFALYQALKSRHWLDEGSLWEICAEMVALFDELTLAGVGLPESEEELAERLARAYETRAGEPLRFEARLVHTLWHAEAAGPLSRAAARLLAS